jgi:cytochrome c5
MRKIVFILAVTFVFAFAHAAKSGEDYFYEKCTSCHGSGLSLNKVKSFQQWQKTIKRMKRHGLSINGSTTKSIAKFLAEKGKK